MSVERSAVIAVSVGLQGLALLAAGAFAILLARWLGPEGRGEYALFIATANISGVLCGAGIPQGLPYMLSRHGAKAAWVPGNAVLLWAVGLIVLGVLALVGAVAWPGTLRVLGVQGRLGTAFIYVVLLNLLALVQGYLLAAERYYLSFSVPVVQWGSGLAFLWLERGREVEVTVGSVIWSQIAGLIVALLVAAVMGRALLVPPWSLDRSGFTEHLGVGFNAVTSSVGMLLFTRGDVYFIRHWAPTGAADVGLYAVAVTLGELATRIPYWIGASRIPQFARNPASWSLATSLFWAAAAAGSGTWLGLYMFEDTGTSVMQFVLGPAFASSYGLLLMLGPRMILQAANAGIAECLAGIGFPIYHPVGTWLAAVAMAAVSLWTVPAYGAMGAAVASGIGAMVMTLVMASGFRRLRARMTSARVSSAGQAGSVLDARGG